MKLLNVDLPGAFFFNQGTVSCSHAHAWKYGGLGHLNTGGERMLKILNQLSYVWTFQVLKPQNKTKVQN